MKKKLYDDSWMYVLLLSTLIILIESIKGYTFKLVGYDISFSIILIPLIYIISNFITKKYNYKKTIFAIGISTICLIGFLLIMCFAIGKEFIITDIIGDIGAYLASQCINLILCTFLIYNTRPNVILIYSTYLLSLIIFYMTYTIIYLNTMSLDNYWQIYLIAMGINGIICIPLAIIDKLIKLGR